MVQTVGAFRFYSRDDGDVVRLELFLRKVTRDHGRVTAVVIEQAISPGPSKFLGGGRSVDFFLLRCLSLLLGPRLSSSLAVMLIDAPTASEMAVKWPSH